MWPEFWFAVVLLFFVYLIVRTTFNFTYKMVVEMNTQTTELTVHTPEEDNFDR